MKRSRIKDMRHSLKNNGAEAAAKQKDPKQFSSRVCVCLHVGVAMCVCVRVLAFSMCAPRYATLSSNSTERANIEPNRTAKRTQKKNPRLARLPLFPLLLAMLPHPPVPSLASLAAAAATRANVCLGKINKFNVFIAIARCGGFST